MMTQQALAQAMELTRSGRLDSAAALLSKILSDAPGEPDALQLLGMIARSRNDNEKAVELFRLSLRSRPDQPHVLNNLGNALLDLKRPGEAIESYREAVRLQPGYADAFTNLGLACLAEGESDSARDALERAVQIEPRNAGAWSALGRVLRAAGRIEDALAAFRTSVSLRPNNVPTLHNFAVALRLAGEAAEAADLLQQCAATDGRSAEIRYNLGHCYYDLGRLDDAAAAYQAAIRLDPGFRDAHDSLNRLYWQTGNNRDYLASYSAALQRDPNNAGLLADLANRLSLGGRADEAAELLQGALARGADGALLRHRLGQAEWALGRPGPALAHFQAAIEADVEAIEPRLELARTFIIVERYAEALDILAPVLERSPFDQQAIAYQGLAWRFLGDPRADRLNDYERFIRASILEPPPEWGGVENFNRGLEAALARFHTTRQHPLEQTLRGGTQTMGELFDKQVPEIQTVKRMIEGAVSEYIAALPDEPGHVFTSRRSSAFRFAGSWSVRLRSQGFHLNHVHSAGWISSCYYVGLPRAVDRTGSQDGWVKFGETGLDLGDRERIAKAVRPEIGKLVLFPSYMYHGTIPFEEDSYRTTIAFDIVPA